MKLETNNGKVVVMKEHHSKLVERLFGKQESIDKIFVDWETAFAFLESEYEEMFDRKNGFWSEGNWYCRIELAYNCPLKMVVLKEMEFEASIK